MDGVSKFWVRPRPGDPWKDSTQQEQEEYTALLAKTVSGGQAAQLPGLSGPSSAGGFPSKLPGGISLQVPRQQGGRAAGQASPAAAAGMGPLPPGGCASGRLLCWNVDVACACARAGHDDYCARRSALACCPAVGCCLSQTPTVAGTRNLHSVGVTTPCCAADARIPGLPLPPGAPMAPGLQAPPRGPAAGRGMQRGMHAAAAGAAAGAAGMGGVPGLMAAGRGVRLSCMRRAALSVPAALKGVTHVQSAQHAGCCNKHKLQVPLVLQGVPNSQ